MAYVSSLFSVFTMCSLLTHVRIELGLDLTNVIPLFSIDDIFTIIILSAVTTDNGRIFDVFITSTNTQVKSIFNAINFLTL